MPEPMGRSGIGTSKHGTESGYVRGCRCADCRAAHATYQREYRQAREVLAAAKWAKETA